MVKANLPMSFVLEGEDGWLFLAGGAHGPLSFAFGERKPSKESYVSFRRNLHRRSLSAARIDASYIHLIVPDKHTICNDVFPGQVLFSLAESYRNFVELDKPFSQFLLYPDQLLSDIWNTAFYKQDTHLTPFGSLALVQCIVDNLASRYPSKHSLPSRKDIKSLAGKIDLVDSHWPGDLGSKIDPFVDGPRFALKHGHSTCLFSNNFLAGNNGIVDIYINTKFRANSERILLFGDSFGREIATLLAHHFFQVIFLRTPFYHADIASQIRPTIIITEHVERYLSNVSNDDLRPNFLLYPYLKDVAYQPSPDFAKAFSAVLSFGRLPYEQFLDDLG